MSTTLKKVKNDTTKKQGEKTIKKNSKPNYKSLFILYWCMRYNIMNLENVDQEL